MVKEKTKKAESTSDKKSEVKALLLYNDDVNTFEYVIESLVAVCSHEELQAEQCALITHTKGKCSVKNGSFSELEPMMRALLDRGLMADIR
jgi:ATP-dependent Clp protease adaptor protein ClpS